MNKAFCRFLSVVVFSTSPVLWSPALLAQQNPGLGEIETQRCEDKIASVQRDVLGKYEDALLELQNGFQKAADLESAVATRGERQRVMGEGRLTEQNLVAEPKTLRALQSQHLTKLKELTAQLIQDSLPKLLDLKRSLTISGKLDEALAVKASIERLQNNYSPVSRPEPGSVISGDALLQAYAADRVRADKAYKGQKLTVRGVFAGARTDPSDPKTFQVYLVGNGSAWILCTFALSEYRFREEKTFNTTFAVLVPKGDEASAVRLQKGQAIELRGTCEGFDDMVRLTRCELSR